MHWELPHMDLPTILQNHPIVKPPPRECVNAFCLHLHLCLCLHCVNEAFLSFFALITFFIECGTAFLPCDTPSNMASRLLVKTKAQKKKSHLPLKQCKYTEIQSYFF